MNTKNLYFAIPFPAHVKIMSENTSLSPRVLDHVARVLESIFSRYAAHREYSCGNLQSLNLYISIYADGDIRFSFEGTIYNPESQKDGRESEESTLEILRLDFGLACLLFGELITATKTLRKVVDPISGKIYEEYKVVHTVEKRESWGMFDFIDRLPPLIGDALFEAMDAVCSYLLPVS